MNKIIPNFFQYNFKSNFNTNSNISHVGMIAAAILMALLMVQCPGVSDVTTKAEYQEQLDAAQEGMNAQIQLGNYYFLTPDDERVLRVGVELPPYYQLAIRDSLKTAVYHTGPVELLLQKDHPYQLVLRKPNGETIPGYLLIENTDANFILRDEPIFTISKTFIEEMGEKSDTTGINKEYNLSDDAVAQLVFNPQHKNFMDALSLSYHVYIEELLKDMAFLLYSELAKSNEDAANIKVIQFQTQLDEVKGNKSVLENELEEMASQIEELSKSSEEELPIWVEEAVNLGNLISLINTLLGADQSGGLQSELNDLNQESEDLQNQSNNRRERIRAIEAEIKQLQEPLAALQNQIDQVQNRIRAIEILIELYEVAKDPPTTGEGVNRAKNRIQRLLEELRAIDHDEAVSAQLQIGHLDDKRDRISDLFSQLFSIMQQIYTQNCGTNIRNQFCLSLFDRLERTGKALKNLLEQYGTALEIFGDCEGNPEECLAAELARLREQAAALEAQQHNVEEIEDLQQEKLQLQQELTQLTSELNQVNGKINQLKNQLELLVSQNQVHVQEIQDATQGIKEEFPSLSPEVAALLDRLENLLADFDPNGDNTAIFTELASISQELNQRKQALEEQVAQLSEQLQTLLKNHEEKRNELETLKADILSLEQVIQGIQTSMKNENLIYRVFFGRYAPELLEVSSDSPLRGLINQAFAACDLDVYQGCYTTAHDQLSKEAAKQFMPANELLIKTIQLPVFEYAALQDISWDYEMEYLFNGEEPIFQETIIWQILISLFSLDYMRPTAEHFKGVFDSGSDFLGVETKRLDAVWWYLLYASLASRSDVSIVAEPVDRAKYLDIPPFALSVTLRGNTYRLIYTPEVNPYEGIPPFNLY